MSSATNANSELYPAVKVVMGLMFVPWLLFCASTIPEPFHVLAFMGGLATVGAILQEVLVAAQVPRQAPPSIPKPTLAIPQGAAPSTPAPSPPRLPKPRTVAVRHRQLIAYLPGRYRPTGVYLDECGRKAIAVRLRAMGVTAHHAHELGHRSWADEKHLDYAACKRLLIITSDHDFDDLDAAGEPHAGILRGPNSEPYDLEYIRLALEQLG